VALILIFTFLSFRRNGLNHIISLAGILVILGFTLIGARLIGVLYKYPFYIDGLDKLISVKYGDFSLFGGLIFAVLGGFVFARITRKNVLKIADDLVFPLGGAIMLWRIGCFLNGCCLGKETLLPWGVCFDKAGTIVHPTQLYEAASVAIILIVLLIIKKRIKKPGIFSLIFFISFAFAYLIVSVFRAHSLYGIVLSIILSLVLIGGILLIGISETRKNYEANR
jgi:phosphatidylglycerol:prolipoprotein diacylglycerol transferase